MFDTKFKQALFDCMTQEYDLLLSDEDDYKYEFSKKFERKMKKLISRRNKSYYHIINTSHKRAACIILAIIIATITAVAGVGAIRDKIKKYHILRLKEYSIIRSMDIDEVNDNKVLEDTCNITYGLEGYKVNYISAYSNSRSISYCKGDINISLDQYLSGQYDSTANTEGVEVQKIYINGNEALYFKDITGIHTYIWDDGKYAFNLKSDGTKEESLKMAESVKRVGDFCIEDPYIIYKPTYGLNDLTLFSFYINYDLSDSQSNISSSNLYYTSSDGMVNISYQETKNDVFDYEDYIGYLKSQNYNIYKTDINGKDSIFFLDNNYYYHFLWSNNEYTFELYGTFSKNEGKKIAESVKKE